MVGFEQVAEYNLFLGHRLKAVDHPAHNQLKTLLYKRAPGINLPRLGSVCVFTEANKWS